MYTLLFCQRTLHMIPAHWTMGRGVPGFFDPPGLFTDLRALTHYGRTQFSRSRLPGIRTHVSLFHPDPCDPQLPPRCAPSGRGVLQAWHALVFCIYVLCLHHNDAVPCASCSVVLLYCRDEPPCEVSPAYGRAPCIISCWHAGGRFLSYEGVLGHLRVAVARTGSLLRHQDFASGPNPPATGGSGAPAKRRLVWNARPDRLLTSGAGEACRGRDCCLSCRV